MTAKKVASEADAAGVTVTVADGTQVSHEATVYGPGETLTVPPELADKWTANGWATTAD